MDREYLIKLTSNLYQLTLLFPKKEPLRYKMRELADEVLADSLRITCLPPASPQANGRRANIYESTNRSNPSIKTEVYSRQILENLGVLDSYFAIAKEQNWISPQNLLSLWEEYSKIKEYLEELNKERPSFTPPIKQEKKERSNEKKRDLNERQQKILEILKEKEKAQVGELKEIFPDVTKRTLRRDFQQLFKNGKIEKIGEKNNTYYQVVGRT